VSTYDVTLLTSIVKHHQPASSLGIAVVSFSMSGEPHAAAIVDAVIADYHRVTGRPPITAEQRGELVTQKVTLLRVTTGMVGARAIVASPGTIFQASGRLGLLPKGKRREGYRISADALLDVQPGYTAVEQLDQRVATVRAGLPQLTELTKARLAQLPSNGGDCSLAVFGTWRLPDKSSAGAIWLLRSYLGGGDIAQGLLLVRPEDGLSEHGSVLGEQLLQVGGEIIGAPVLPWQEALALVDADYATVLARVTGRRP
jgi:hypothetical protein